jgi:hypothetical protein
MPVPSTEQVHSRLPVEEYYDLRNLAQKVDVSMAAMIRANGKARLQLPDVEIEWP